MADTVAPMITDARAELPPYAQLLAGLTLLDPNRLNSMPDMSDPISTLATSDGTSAALMLSVAPGHAAAISYQGLAHSLSLLMLGDTNAHNSFGATSIALVTATTALLLEAGGNRG